MIEWQDAPADPAEYMPPMDQGAAGGRRLYNVACAVVELVEATDEEAAKEAVLLRLTAQGFTPYEGEITSPTGIDAFESEPLS